MCLALAEIDAIPRKRGSKGPMGFFPVEIVTGCPEVLHLTLPFP